MTDGMPFKLSVFDVAVAKGGRLINGTMNGAEFDRLGLPMLSGCQNCGAMCGPGNAYPTKTGFIQCGDCEEMSDLGFSTIEAYELFMARGPEPEPRYAWTVILQMHVGSDDDDPGDPKGWDWHSMLRLSPHETVKVVLTALERI